MPAARWRGLRAAGLTELVGQALRRELSLLPTIDQQLDAWLRETLARGGSSS
ncbi:MAG: hypothetical protein KatS3mg103_0391 [Phycisphaerales bacterium]|nr:MAG: hypothetical protein KatS3mg103_0391 [Phycisphaerales bacterium]